MLEKLQNQVKSIGSDQQFIMSNVAIASAVTAYARIHMIPFKSINVESSNEITCL